MLSIIILDTSKHLFSCVDKLVSVYINNISDNYDKYDCYDRYDENPPQRDEKCIIYPIMAPRKFYNQGGPETQRERRDKRQKERAGAQETPTQ